MLDDASDFDAMFASASAEDKALDTGTMHATDCQWIVTQVRELGPDAIPGVMAFVVNSIQQPFYSIASRMDDTARHGTASRYLMGHKRAALLYAWQHKVALWKAAQSTDLSLDALLMEYLRVPGLGIVKASFLAQLTTGHGACLDGINSHRLGIAKDAWRHRTEWSEKTRLAKVRAYNAYWSAIGSSAYWWDTWCEFQGTRETDIRGYAIASPGSPEDVSRLHRRAIDLRINAIMET